MDCLIYEVTIGEDLRGEGDIKVPFVAAEVEIGDANSDNEVRIPELEASEGGIF